jgi:hypothetical protein
MKGKVFSTLIAGVAYMHNPANINDIFIILYHSININLIIIIIIINFI